MRAVDPDPVFPKVLDPDLDCEVQNATLKKNQILVNFSIKYYIFLTAVYWSSPEKETIKNAKEDFRGNFSFFQN